MLLGEASSAAEQAAAERIADAAAQYLQQLDFTEGAGATQSLPAPVRELLRVTAAGAGQLSDGELEATAQHVCRAARRDVEGAEELAALLRWASVQCRRHTLQTNCLRAYIAA